MTATVGFILGIIVLTAGLAVIYRYRERLKGRSQYLYYGSILGVVVLAVVVAYASIIFTSSPTVHVSQSPGVNIDQEPGMVEFTIVAVGRLEGAKIAGPDGTRSTETRNAPEESIPLQSGTRITLRSNEEVISYLNNTNITVPTTSGIKTVNSVDELPSEYQRASDGFIDPDADIGNYDNASVATVACLYTVPEFEIGDRNIPAGASIPCSTPILGQNDIEEDYLGAHVKPSSGTNKGKILVSPVILREGEHYFVGTIEGHEVVFESVRVTDAQSKKNETVTEGEE
jgi:hypothetical protein